MLSSMEMVSEPSGKTKTLADLIKEGGILTPETPVYTSDDSIELEDYIESLIPAPTPSFSETVLFLNEDVSGGNPAEIDLSDDYINYDALYIDVVRSADTTLYQMPHLILVSVLGNDGKFQFIEQDKFVSYGVTNSKKFTRLNVSSSQNVIIRSIIGIKF